MTQEKGKTEGKKATNKKKTTTTKRLSKGEQAIKKKQVLTLAKQLFNQKTPQEKQAFIGKIFDLSGEDKAEKVVKKFEEIRGGLEKERADKAKKKQELQQRVV